jgi:hypothetical protein
LRESDGDFLLEAEAILSQIEVGQNLPPECLIACPHVGKVQVGYHVRNYRQERVADVVPEKQDAMRAAKEARPIDHVGSPGLDGCDKTSVVGWVVLKVGILDDYDLTFRLFESAPEGCTLAHIPWLQIGMNLRIFKL